MNSNFKTSRNGILIDKNYYSKETKKRFAVDKKFKENLKKYEEYLKNQKEKSN